MRQFRARVDLAGDKLHQGVARELPGSEGPEDGVRSRGPVV